MVKDTKPCKICGKPFIPCLTQLPSGFNWRTVSCSPECGQIYLHKVMVSRGLIQEEIPEPVVEESEIEEEVVEVEKTEEQPEVEVPRKKKK